MKHAYYFFLILCIFFSLSTAQTGEVPEQNDEKRVEQTTENFEKFVESIVDRVEKQIGSMVEQRSQHVEYNNEHSGQDQEKEYPKSSSNAVTFNGNTEIAETDTVQGDLVVKNGTLTVRGTVVGDVLVVNGDIELKSRSRVLGNVRTMNGSITKDERSYVEGYTEQSLNSSPKNSKRKNTLRTKYSYSFKPYFLNSGNDIDDNILFRYNRVEGIFFGFGSEKKYYWDGSKVISGYGSFGYGFASHKWRLQLGLDRQFAASDEILFESGGEVHSLTDTKDEWIMNLGENNLAALFFREDFRDYFQREGFSLHSALYTKKGDFSGMLDVRFLNDRYASLDNRARWGVFGSNEFRNNPFVNVGTMKSISLSAVISTVEKYRYRSEGWNVFLRGEYAGRELGGDFGFTQTVIDIRRFQPLSDDDQINLRVRAGALEGNPIIQKSFELGGANTMPAYGFKEFAGNRMLLGNLEYRISGDLIDNIPFWPNSLSLIAFGDAGAVTNVKTALAVYEGFSSIQSSRVKSDYGFAIAWHDGDARLGFAWRTDKQQPVSIFFRLNRSF